MKILRNPRVSIFEMVLEMSSYNNLDSANIIPRL